MNDHPSNDSYSMRVLSDHDVIMKVWGTNKYSYRCRRFCSICSYHDFMDPASSIFGQVIHYVYTWLPMTAKNSKRSKKDSRQCKKRVNFSQSAKDKSESSLPIAALKSSHGLPSTPNCSKLLLLHSLPGTCQGQEGFLQEYPCSNLEIVGYKFLSNEKKTSKRSALKRWLRQRTNVVHKETVHFDERFDYGGRHDLCCREVFECSPKLAGKALKQLDHFSFWEKKPVLSSV